MPAATLFGHPRSPFCRSVSIVLELLDVQHEYKTVDLTTGQQNSEDYKKVNQQHNVPYFIDSDGFELNESRAILIYLAQKYDKSKKLYPDCVRTQARINQRLFFDACVLYPALRDIFHPLVFLQNKEVLKDEAKTGRMKEVFGWLNGYVAPTGYIAGTDHMTVADIATYVFFASIQAVKVFANVDDYPEAKKWAANVKSQIKNYEKVEGEGLKIFEEFFRAKTGLI